MNLTTKQLRVCEFIANYAVKHGVSPTIREIADELDISTNTAYLHTLAAERKGAVARGAYAAARNLAVTQAFVESQQRRSAIAAAMARAREASESHKVEEVNA